MSSLTLRKAALAVDLSETGRRIAAAGMKPRVSLYAYGRFDSPIVTEVPVLNKNFMYWGATYRLFTRLNGACAKPHGASARAARHTM